MRKKFLATLLVGAIAATGVIGFTACNNDGNDDGELQKGEQVTEEQWKTSIAATAAAENYTVIAHAEDKSDGVKQDDSTVKVTYSYNTSSKTLYDLVGKKVYSEGKITEKSSGMEAMGEDDVDRTETNEMYHEIEGSEIWECHAFDNGKWTAGVNDCGTEAAAKKDLSDFYGFTASLVNTKVSLTADGEKTTIPESYSAFEYKDGFYTATLYGLFSNDAVDVTISLKNGYMTGIGYSVADEETDDGFDITTSVKATYVFSAFGTTTVTTPSGAAEAIEAAKTPADDGTVAGKTFVFGRLDLEFDASVSAEMREMYESMKPQMAAAYAGSKIIFGNNGDFTMIMSAEQGMTAVGTYTENNNNVVLTPVTINGQAPEGNAEPETFTLSDSTLSARVEYEGVTMIMNYVLQA